MSEQHTPPPRSRQPHYSFMRPLDFGFFVFLLVYNAWLISTLWSSPEAYFQKWLITTGTSVVATIGYAWLRFQRRNLCADAGELTLSIFIPLTTHLVYEQLNGSDSRGLILTSAFAVLLPFMAWQVWRAPKVARKLAEELAAIRRAHADPRFTHIENP